MRDRRRTAAFLSDARGVSIAVAALVLTVSLGLSVVGHLELREARRRNHEAAADLARLLKENDAVRRQVRRFSEDPIAVEDLARRELGMLRPGEILFIVRDADGSTPDLREPDAPAGDSRR